VILEIDWLKRMERRTILGGGIFALTLLALVCIPRHVPSSASSATSPVPANFHAHLEQGTLLLRGSLPDSTAHDRVIRQARAAYDPAHVRVVDQLTIDSRIASPSWVSQLPGILSVLEPMQGARSVMIDGRFLVLSGTVPSEQVKATILKTVSPLRSIGLELEDHMTVAATPPSVRSLQARIDELLSRSQIEFDSNQATLTAHGRAVLDRLVPILTQAPRASIEIGGHTDAYGAPDYNKDLSRRRAETVREYLKAHGVSHDMTAVGYGASKPRAAGNTRAALQRNRRIELRVLETHAL
jgi:OOP family OmpA-OmpF porin